MTAYGTAASSVPRTIRNENRDAPHNSNTVWQYAPCAQAGTQGDNGAWNGSQPPGQMRQNDLDGAYFYVALGRSTQRAAALVVHADGQRPSLRERGSIRCSA